MRCNHILGDMAMCGTQEELRKSVIIKRQETHSIVIM